MDCPVCHAAVPGDRLERHVNACLDAGAAEAPAVVAGDAARAVPTGRPAAKKVFAHRDPGPAPAPPAAAEVCSCKDLIPGYLRSHSGAGHAFKTVLGTTFTVDAFKLGPLPGCTAYFLSHFHSDHYDGLTRAWAAPAPIYCSVTTARLAIMRLGVSDRLVHVLPMHEWVPIQGSRVMLIDAEHCPGSVMLLFELPDGRLVLHTGDFRASPELLARLAAALAGRALHATYLDNTYAAPAHTFPSQASVVADCAALVGALVADRAQVRFSPIKRLVLVGSYVVGKERIALAIAQQLGTRIYVPTWKRAVLNAFDWPGLQALLTDDPRAALVHIVPMSGFNQQGLSEYLDPYYPATATHILAIRPTGWAGLKPTTTCHDYRSASTAGRGRKQALTVHSVPYSEHSSYTELLAFLAQHPADVVIPTVGLQDCYVRCAGVPPDAILAAIRQ